MTRFARVLVLALIAVFAAWSSAHVANATTMALEMAAVDGDAMDMADCDACESGEMGDQASLACNMACVSPVLAVLVTGQTLTPAPVGSHTGWATCTFPGQTYPPDPYPPRAVLLI